jgi:hypothetical protein
VAIAAMVEIAVKNTTAIFPDLIAILFMFEPILPLRQSGEFIGCRKYIFRHVDFGCDLTGSAFRELAGLPK